VQEDFERRYHEAQAEAQRLASVIEELRQQLKQSNEANEELRQLLRDLGEKLDQLIAQKKKRNKRDYGKKTEKHNPQPALEQPQDAIRSDRNRKNSRDKSTGTKHILENANNLPHEAVQHKVSPQDCICPTCNIETELVGSLLTHQLEMVSASLKILDHSQETRACPKCKQYIVTAEKPHSPIPGSYAGSRLLAEIIVGKLDDGLPNNRQQKIFARHNVVIPRSTQCDWMQYTATTLSLLYDRLRQDLLRSKIIKTDDSLIKVQDRKHKDNIRKGKITAYVGDSEHRVTMFDYSPNQSFSKNCQFLADFLGIVQADAAGGFDALYEDGKRIEAGCSAHSRRKYFEAEFTDINLSGTVLDIYRDLYIIERQIKDKPAPYRLAMRRRKSKPLTKRLWKIITAAKSTLSPKHELMKAINYTVKHWLALTRFLKNPDIAIDNNESERAIKCWVLVRKNALFAGSDDGAQAIAVHLSFIATCKRNGVNPVDWYADVLSRINSSMNTELQLQQLLPQNWPPPQGP
jgi:transposase